MVSYKGPRIRTKEDDARIMEEYRLQLMNRYKLTKTQIIFHGLDDPKISEDVLKIKVNSIVRAGRVKPESQNMREMNLYPEMRRA